MKTIFKMVKRNEIISSKVIIAEMSMRPYIGLREFFYSSLSACDAIAVTEIIGYT